MFDPQRLDDPSAGRRLASVPPPMPLRPVAEEDGVAPQPVELAPEPVADERELELAEREAVLERREAAVAEQEAELGAARAAFDNREAELERAQWRLAEERVALEAEREHLRQEARPAVEQPAGPETDWLDAERRRLERAEAILHERHAELERLRKSLPLVPGTFVWDVGTLAHLVEECADEFPERIDEWRAYLAELERSRDPDGTLPARLDPLVWEVFEPLLERPRLPFAL
jgi:hypothetical protein